MKKIAIVLAVFAVLSTSVALAKRGAPAKVNSVRLGGTEYRAPRDQIGCIEALDTLSGRLIWRRQIYVVKYNTNLERDVQDVFVKAMKIKDSTLVVVNERKSEYILDLKTLEVAVVKGTLVENKGSRVKKTED